MSTLSPVGVRSLAMTALLIVPVDRRDDGQELLLDVLGCGRLPLVLQRQRGPLTSSPQGNDVWLWIHDAIDQRGQVLKSLPLLLVKFMSVVDTAHAADDVAKAALGMIARHFGSAH